MRNMVANDKSFGVFLGKVLEMAGLSQEEFIKAAKQEKLQKGHICPLRSGSIRFVREIIFVTSLAKKFSIVNTIEVFQTNQIGSL